MKFTTAQCTWIIAEQKRLADAIASNPQVGIYRLVAKQEALRLLVELHNIEVPKRDLTVQEQPWDKV